MAKKKRKSDAEKSADGTEQVDFEAALADVEKVVHELENGELGLTESLAQYEQGIEKIKLCHQVLERAEKRISVLMSVDEDGNASVQPVDVQADDLALGGSGTAKSAVRKKPRPPISDVDEAGGLF